jgi:hypothetical protein
MIAQSGRSYAGGNAMLPRRSALPWVDAPLRSVSAMPGVGAISPMPAGAPEGGVATSGLPGFLSRSDREPRRRRRGPPRQLAGQHWAKPALVPLLQV